MAFKKLNPKAKQDEVFIPPDGGWGWMIVMAAGFSNLFAIPVLQQFGLLFRDKFATLGITNMELTTILNINSAMTSCVGLINGPVFRTFTYRKVSLTGAVLVFSSLLMTTFSFNFVTYLVSFILYGAAFGISSSANALALNTYWKDRRRLATSLSWTTTGIGPMVWPHIITVLFAYYGEPGTVLIITGLSLHAIAFALLLQPVEWHTKNNNKKDEENNLIKSEQENSNVNEQLSENKQESGYFSSMTKLKNLSMFSSQYLYNEDDPSNTGYEIIDPGIPMMIRGNDGYFTQSRPSLSRLTSKDGSAQPSRMNSQKPSMANLLNAQSRKSSTLNLNESKRNSSINLGVLSKDREVNKPKRKNSITIETQIPELEIEDCPTFKAPQDLKAEEKVAVENIDPEKAKVIEDNAKNHSAANKSRKTLRVDGQYGEKYNRDNQSIKSGKRMDDYEDKIYLRDNHSNQSKSRRKSNNFNYENEVLKQASRKLEEYLKQQENDLEEKLKLLINSPLDTDDDDDVFDDKKTEEVPVEVEEKLTFCQKVCLFFDLDLLKDYTFVNLMLGTTLASFNEMNFSLLTPFILSDFGFTKSEVALYMSLLAGVDLSIRFCIPLIAGKIGWDNNTFFLFGVMSMAMGRVVLSVSQDFKVVMAVAVIVGVGKGFRTVFMALVIPTYVPLEKLPGASGIQLVTAGIVYLALGPLVGWIKEHASITVTLHCLNIFTWLTAISWGLEKFITSRRDKKTVITQL